MVGFVKGQDRQDLHCTGTILSSTWIITAAHCFKPGSPDLSTITAVMGSQNLRKLSTQYRKDIAIKYFKMHPEYEENTLKAKFDIAMVKLEETIVFDSFVYPICLPNFKGN